MQRSQHFTSAESHERIKREVTRHDRRRRFDRHTEKLPLQDMSDLNAILMARTPQEKPPSVVLQQYENMYKVTIATANVKLEFDTTGDGANDTILVDMSGDGQADHTGKAIDTSGDGKADKVGLDTNGDGQLDTYVDIHFSGDAFSVGLRKTGPDTLLLTAPSRKLLTLDIIMDAIEAYGLDVAKYQASEQPSVTDADFELFKCVIGEWHGQRSTQKVDTTQDGKPDHEAEQWQMPEGAPLFADALAAACDVITVFGHTRFVVDSTGPHHASCSCCGSSCAVQ